MADRRATPKRRNRAKENKTGDALCAAVAAWVKAMGGKPAVVGDVTVNIEDEFRFTVSVRVTGTPPPA